MFSGLNQTQRYGVVGLSAFGLAIAGFLGSQALKKPAEMRFGSESSLSAAAESTKVVVHVSGAVKKPGLVELPNGSRVSDAIKAAGGETEDADLSQLNLAERLTDGVKLTVPKVGEVLAPAAPIKGKAGTSSGGKTGSKSGKKEMPAPASISLNQATQEELERLPGVGPSTAAKILAYRQQSGGFRSIDELQAVKGIGPKKLEKLRPFLKL